MWVMDEAATTRTANRPEGLDAVLIAGPTASGKSAFAIAVARATGGVIVNADSMQVYRDLAVITARPSPEDERAAEHRLYGVIDGAENFSVGRYAERAGEEIAAVWRTGRLPILVGGTGLYFSALEEGLSAIPAIPDHIRTAERAACDGVDTGALHARLASLDPAEAARLRPSDRLRVMRALEVIAATGRPLSHFHGARTPGVLAGKRLKRLFLAPERSTVHAAIDRRFETMMATGALDEVKVLAARGLDPLLPIMRAHGVPALIAHLRGEMSLADAIQRGQGDTRAYVKRQFTWFRRQGEAWRWLADAAARAAALEDAAHRARQKGALDRAAGFD
jgi:tRNA dimethylallyltransferase